MATVLKLDGDAETGWAGEVHDGQLATYSPEGRSVFEALFNMLHTHFGGKDKPAET